MNASSTVAGGRCRPAREATIGDMADVPCHTVEWTRLEIGDRSWRVKLEYG
jgi:hypothetical protein